MNAYDLARWRLVLGDRSKIKSQLDDSQLRIDKALAGVYEGELTKGRTGGRGKSSPYVATWLGDIREFFPQSVVQVMQKDAIDRLGLSSLLTEKEVLETITPDVGLVANLLTLKDAVPSQVKDNIRVLIQKVVDEVKKKLEQPLQQAVTGALNRSIRKRNPRYKEIDWHTTILKNLKNYQKEYKTIIPEVRIGFGRKGQALKDIVICLDESGSMGSSVVYSGIFGSVLASIPAVSTRMVVFDTEVVDLSDNIQDPVDILFGVQLGGGTDIDKALNYCQGVITRPQDTVMVVVTDLYEGGNQESMRRRFYELHESGVKVVVLLALSDDGAPYYDKNNAKFLASLGIPAFACTPDLFPDLLAAVLRNQDLDMWVDQNINHTEQV